MSYATINNINNPIQNNIAKLTASEKKLNVAKPEININNTEHSSFKLDQVTISEDIKHDGFIFNDTTGYGEVIENEPLPAIVTSEVFVTSYDKNGNRIQTRIKQSVSSLKQDIENQHFNFNFTRATTDFIYEAAKKYAEIGENQEFRYNIINDSTEFMLSAVELITNGKATGDDYKSVNAQVKDLVRELAENMKNGKSTDLHDLKTKLTISGKDTTIGELVDIQKSLGEFSKEFDSKLSMSTGDFGTIGIYGMADALTGYAMNNISSKFGNELAVVYREALKHRFDGVVKTADNFAEKLSNEFADEDKHVPYEYYVGIAFSGTAKEEVYNLFNEIGSKSSKNLNKQFDEAIAKFTNIAKKVNNRVVGGVDIKRDTNGLKKFFDFMTKQH